MLALKTILEDTSEDFVLEVFSGFKCSQDEDIERFLKEKAVLFEKKSKSRTYLIFDTKSMEQGELKLLAYFTVAIQSLKLPENISNSRIKELDGLYTKRNNNKISEIPAFLIGQLAKNDCFKSEINGSKVLEMALSILAKCQAMVGGRIVYIECRDIESIKNFYFKNDFEYLRKDPDDNLIQMYVVLE